MVYGMMHHMTTAMFYRVMDRVVNLGKGSGGHQQ
jgi:hypothetical protein